MAVPPPPRLSASVIGNDGKLDARAVAEAIKALREYTSQVYNATRQSVRAMELIAQLSPLTQSISASPTQAEVSAIQAKVNEIIVTANTPIGDA